jgi:hypothetical protein
MNDSWRGGIVFVVNGDFAGLDAVTALYYNVLVLVPEIFVREKITIRRLIMEVFIEFHMHIM